MFAIKQQQTNSVMKKIKTWKIILIAPKNHWHISDSEPPVFTNCETELTIPAESRSTSAVVNWTVPTASDYVDESLTVVQLAGPKPGTRIVGEVTVKYQTTDQAGNPSEICSMQIKVEGKGKSYSFMIWFDIYSALVSVVSRLKLRSL